MAGNTEVDWAKHSFNLWWGCVMASIACMLCYAEAMAKRFGVIWGKGQRRKFNDDAYWQAPFKWNAQAAKANRRDRVFCSSMSDVFESESTMHDDDVPLAKDARERLWGVIEATPNLIWMLLTKRPENIMRMLPERWHAQLPDNVWVGTTTENQKTADTRIPELLKVPAVVRFISYEPARGPLDIRRYLATGLHWVIAGGESGHVKSVHASHPQWYYDVRDQVLKAGQSFYFKQWGEWIPKIELSEGMGKGNYPWGVLDYQGEFAAESTPWNGTQNDPDHAREVTVVRLGKKNTGYLLAGKEWRQVPDPANPVGKSYIASKPCGCVSGAIVADTTTQVDAALRRWQRQGLVTEKVGDDYVREYLWKTCPVCDKTQQPAASTDLIQASML